MIGRSGKLALGVLALTLVPAAASACRYSPVRQMLLDSVPRGLGKDVQVLEVTFRRPPASGAPIPRDDTYQTARVRRVLRGPQVGDLITVRVPGVCHFYARRVSGLLVGRLVADPRAPGGRAFVAYEVSGRALVDRAHRTVAHVGRSPPGPRVMDRPTPSELQALLPPAIRARRFSHAVVACSIARNGRPHDCVVVEESPHRDFGPTALRAAAAYRFYPSILPRTVDPSVTITVAVDDRAGPRSFP